MATDDVHIWTDGSCSPNPGPGGWGALLTYGDHVRELHGSHPDTTNNQMELTAAIEALEALTRRSTVHLHTDSTYVRNGISSWLAKWRANGWRTAAKQPVKNAELWQRLAAATERHDVQWHWVKGHAGDPGNERADQLANLGTEEAKAAAG